MSVCIRAYAKINLMLDILSKLENGYHEVFTVMQSVGIFDEITVTLNNSRKISVSCNVNAVPDEKSNIAYKAAEVFFRNTGTENCGVAIEIQKNIPYEAGLGGGSADAAAVIIALDKLFYTNLNEKSIIRIASQIGADVPFCALGGTMLGQYTGTVLSHLPDLDKKYVVIVKPCENISTEDAYSAFDKAERIRHLDTKNMLISVIGNDWKKASEKVDNVFEQFIEVTDRAVIKGIMRKHSCICSCMSGSGPSIFGIFENEKDAENCRNELKKDFPDTFICTTTDKGLEIL